MTLDAVLVYFGKMEHHTEKSRNFQNQKSFKRISNYILEHNEDPKNTVYVNYDEEEEDDDRSDDNGSANSDDGSANSDDGSANSDDDSDSDSDDDRPSGTAGERLRPREASDEDEDEDEDEDDDDDDSNSDDNDSNSDDNDSNSDDDNSMRSRRQSRERTSCSTRDSRAQSGFHLSALRQYSTSAMLATASHASSDDVCRVTPRGCHACRLHVHISTPPPDQPVRPLRPPSSVHRVPGKLVN